MIFLKKRAWKNKNILDS